MSQDDLARAAGVSVPTVRSLERGRGSLRSMVRVMDRLELGWGWFDQAKMQPRSSRQDTG